MVNIIDEMYEIINEKKQNNHEEYKEQYFAELRLRDKRLKKELPVLIERKRLETIDRILDFILEKQPKAHYDAIDEAMRESDKATEWLEIDDEKRRELHLLFQNKYKKELSSNSELLKNPNLFDIINNEFDKKIVDEEETRKTIFLIALGGSLTDNASATSTNLMVNDEAGAGKDHITNEVLNIIPSDMVVKRKRISEKVFTYWKNKKNDPLWTWDGKIFYNEDISNQVLNSDVFKVMSSTSGESKSTVIINQSAVDIIIVGKPVMIITTYSANPTQELLRRYPICNLNTTEAQTKLILKRKAEFAMTGVKPEYDDKIIKNLSKLKRVNVKVPFADKLVEVLSTKNIIIRTHFDRFIDYIKFSASIHQYQRNIDSDGYVEANEIDYEIGRKALIKTTSNVFSVPLTKIQTKILDILRDLTRTSYSVTDLEQYVSFCSDRTLRTELDKLTNLGFLEKDKEDREGSKKAVMVYSYLELYKINIPTWEELQNTSSLSINEIVSNDSSVSNDDENHKKTGTNETNETNEADPRPLETEKVTEEVVDD